MAHLLRFDHQTPTLYWIDDAEGIWNPQPIQELAERLGILVFDYPEGADYSAATVQLMHAHGIWSGGSTSGGHFRAVRAETGTHSVVTGTYQGENGYSGAFVLVFPRQPARD